MSIKLASVCPVCGRPKGAVSLSEYDCGHCGFQNAYLQSFADPESMAQWQKAVQAAKAAWQAKQRAELARAHRLSVSGHGVALLVPQEHTLYLVSTNGQFLTEQNVVQFSPSERNDAVVYADGTVKVVGEDNSYGQRDTDQWRDIQFALAAPNCTYGVTKTGTVLIQGAPADPAVREWTDIQTLACGTRHVVGLTTTGTARVAGTLPAGAGEAVAAWQNVTYLTAARDCVAALHLDGTVSFAGKPNDPRKAAEQWQNILSVACDSAYVYGLTQDGRLLMAGACKAFLDKGRSGAAQWTELMELACNAAGVGAVDAAGELHFAGTMTGDVERVLAVWQEKLKPLW